MKYHPNNFDAIIFDLGGVILNLDYNRTIAAFEKLGMMNFESYYTKAQQEQVFDNYETGTLSSAKFRDYFRDTIDSHLTDEEIDNAWNAMLLDLPAERIALINEIKQHCPVYLFSNTNEIHLTAFQEIIHKEHADKSLLENTFHQTYYSHLVGERKPNPAAFNTVINDHNLNPEKVLFIDDSEQHIAGALALGIQAHHLVDEDITDLFDLS